MTERGWARLSKAAEDRRLHLRMRQVDVHAAGGPSVAWQSKLANRDDGPPSSRELPVLPRLDRALRWPEGTAYAVVMGGDPPVDVDDEVSRFVHSMVEHLHALPPDVADERMRAIATLLGLRLTETPASADPPRATAAREPRRPR